MKFAIVYDGLIKEYREYPAQPECKVVDGLPVVRPVVELVKPTFDPITQQLEKTVTVFDDRVEWSWTVVALPAEQIAANQQDVADAAHKAQVKLETQVQNFIAMTPAEVNSYIDAQVTDLTSAKTVLKFFGRMLLILVRREYRN